MPDARIHDLDALRFEDESGFSVEQRESSWPLGYYPVATDLRAELENWNRKAAAAFQGAHEHPELQWGGLNVNWQVANYHFAVAGPPGSGKTLTIRFLLQSVANMMGRGRGVRALTVDSKGDMRPLLEGIVNSYGLDADTIVSFYPFGYKPDAWDLAAEIGDDAPTAFTVANAFIPQVRTGERFFREAAQTLVAGVFRALHRVRQGDWDLRDVCLAFRSEQDLAKLLSQASQVKSIGERLLGQDQMARGILAELTNAFTRLEPVAAVWHQVKPSRRFTTAKFFENEHFLLLGTTPMYLEVLRPLNQILLRRLADVALSRGELDPTRDTEQSFFIFDELSYLAGLAPIRHLLTLGRSKGICCVLGYQDIGIVRADFGPDEANALCGMPGNQALFPSPSPAHAEWSSLVCGRMERLLRRNRSTSRSVTQGEHASNQKTWTDHYEAVLDYPIVHPYFIQNRARWPASTGFSGFYRTAALERPWYHPVKKDDGLWKMLVAPEPMPTEVASPPGLLRWTAEEREALGLDMEKSDDEGGQGSLLNQLREELLGGKKR